MAEIWIGKEVQVDYECQAKMFRVLGNPVRIRILAMLAHGPLCVSDLIRCTCQRQAYISQQLMFLRSKDTRLRHTTLINFDAHGADTMNQTSLWKEPACLDGTGTLRNVALGQPGPRSVSYRRRMGPGHLR